MFLDGYCIPNSESIEGLKKGINFKVSHDSLKMAEEFESCRIDEFQ